MISRHCDKTTCRPFSIVEHNVLRDCKCLTEQRKVIHETERCCCPPPKESTACDQEQNTLKKVKIFYVLGKNMCFKKVLRGEEKISEWFYDKKES